MNTPARSKSRAAARLAAVQALYQRQMESTHLARLLDEFTSIAWVGDRGRSVCRGDVDFFDDVVSGAIAREEEIDALLSDRLPKAGASRG